MTAYLTEANFAAFCWLFVGISAIVADFTGYVRKTIIECVALAIISLGSFSRAYYVFTRHEIPADGLWIAVALAFYCVAMWYKMLWVVPRRPDYKPPRKSKFY